MNAAQVFPGVGLAGMMGLGFGMILRDQRDGAASTAGTTLAGGSALAISASATSATYEMCALRDAALAAGGESALARAGEVAPRFGIGLRAAIGVGAAIGGIALLGDALGFCDLTGRGD